MPFADHNLDADIVQGLTDLGYEDLLEVQVSCLDPIRQGRHLSVRSRTGTGKTAAFGIPLLEMTPADDQGPHLLILAPTRELAVQIGHDLSAIGGPKGLKVMTGIGGASIGAQIQALKEGAQIVVGTPGRLLDLNRRRELDLTRVSRVVLDEADEMLSMGFFEDVTGLMDACKNTEQVIILSASLNEETQGLIDRYTTDLVRIDLSVDTLSVDGIDHVYYKIGDSLPKHHYLLHVLAVEKPTTAIVFVNTRSDASLVATHVAREGLHAEMLSGELPQKERERVMAATRSGDLRILVATDVAARGIDISHLSHVINFSLPEDPAIYLHRVGRTGRVGRKGTAISLISGSRVRTLGLLERQFRIKFEERIFPSKEEMVTQRNEAVLDTLIDEAGKAICDGYLSQAGAVLSHDEATQIIAYLLKKRADQVHDELRTKENRPAPKQRSGRPSGRRSDRGGRSGGRGGRSGGRDKRRR